MSIPTIICRRHHSAGTGSPTLWNPGDEEALAIAVLYWPAVFSALYGLSTLHSHDFAFTLSTGPGGWKETTSLFLFSLGLVRVVILIIFRKRHERSPKHTLVFLVIRPQAFSFVLLLIVLLGSATATFFAGYRWLRYMA